MMELSKDELKAIARVRLYKTNYMKLFMNIWSYTLFAFCVALVGYLAYVVYVDTPNKVAVVESGTTFNFIIIPIACIAIIGLICMFTMEGTKGKQIFKELEAMYNKERS